MRDMAADHGNDRLAPETEWAVAISVDLLRQRLAILKRKTARSSGRIRTALSGEIRGADGGGGCCMN